MTEEIYNIRLYVEIVKELFLQLFSIVFLRLMSYFFQPGDMGSFR